MKRALLAFVYVGAAVIALAFLSLPIIAIFVHTTPAHLLDQLSNPVVRDAFVVSIKTSVVAQLLILLLGNLVGSVAAAAAAAVFEVGPPLPALMLMALLGSLGFARWIMIRGRRPGGAVAVRSGGAQRQNR